MLALPSSRLSLVLAISSSSLMLCSPAASRCFCFAAGTGSSSRLLAGVGVGPRESPAPAVLPAAAMSASARAAPSSTSTEMPPRRRAGRPTCRTSPASKQRLRRSTETGSSSRGRRWGAGVGGCQSSTAAAGERERWAHLYLPGGPCGGATYLGRGTRGEPACRGQAGRAARGGGLLSAAARRVG
jgi:hypothetical protein